MPLSLLVLTAFVDRSPVTRVVDLRAISSTRIAEHRARSCRCRFDVCSGRGTVESTLSTLLDDKWMPSARKADASTSPLLNIKFDWWSTKLAHVTVVGAAHFVDHFADVVERGPRFLADGDWVVVSASRCIFVDIA